MKIATASHNPIQHCFNRHILPTAEAVEELPDELIWEDSPDAVLRLEHSGKLAGRCSLWWSSTPTHEKQKMGYIGHYAAADGDAALFLLDEACQLLKDSGAQQAIGPVDGSTWKRYRFVTASDTTAPYFLEPTNPPVYVQHFQHSSFTTFARYFSSITTLQSQRTADLVALEQRLYSNGVSIRTLQMSDYHKELQQLFRVALESFAGNLLYVPMAEEDCLRQYQRIRPMIMPDLVLIAECNKQAVGFVLMLPDIKNLNEHHRPDTVIVKTLARLPKRALRGLGELLLAKGQEKARQLGFSSVIHALTHEANQSAALSRKYASRIFREYQLFSRRLH